MFAIRPRPFAPSRIFSLYRPRVRFAAERTLLASEAVGDGRWLLRKGVEYVGVENLFPGDVVLLNYPYWNAAHAYDATSPRSYAAIFHIGGAVARAPRGATAYSGRDVQHTMSIDAVWLSEQDDTVQAAETAWARSFFDALQPHRAGVYVNFLDSDDDTSRVREAYGNDMYQRLAEVKAKYDPENVFHNNKNIQPATPAQ